MSLLRNITSGLRSLFRKEGVDKELDEEMRGFLKMAAREKMNEGMSRQDAVRAVRLEQGSVEVTKQALRAAGWECVVETRWHITCCTSVKIAVVAPMPSASVISAGSPALRTELERS